MRAIDCYVDTSALLKLYVSEPHSEDVERYFATLERPAISSLTTLEWHCAMLRRCRSGAFSDAYLALARREFSRHRNEGYFRFCPVNDALFAQALDVLDAVQPVALRSLDAVHLASALSLGKPVFATADKVLATAADKLGLPVATFFS